MTGWTTADFLIYAVAAYVAVAGVLRLITARRAALLAELERDIAKQRAAKPSS